MKKKTGFTLAEVLITLGIVGVVASMTLTVLINNYNKNVTAEKLKKTYNELSQTLKMAETEHGFIDTWDFSNTDNKTEYFYNNYIKPYLKVVKYCNEAEDYSCWADKTLALNGTEYSWKHNASRNSFITAGGYSVMFWISDTGSSASIYIDIDGPNKGANKFGRDIFAFGIWFESEKGLQAQGLNLPDITRDNLLGKTPNAELVTRYLCSKEVVGLYCSGVIVLDGWKIEKDYPW